MSTDQPEGMRGHGESHSDGVGELLPAHERQPSFPGLQRFVNIRFRRYLTQRSKGRGFGWKRLPNSTLYAMGLAYIGSGLLTYRAQPAHGVR